MGGGRGLLGPAPKVCNLRDEAEVLLSAIYDRIRVEKVKD